MNICSWKSLTFDLNKFQLRAFSNIGQSFFLVCSNQKKKKQTKNFKRQKEEKRLTNILIARKSRHAWMSSSAPDSICSSGAIEDWTIWSILTLKDSILVSLTIFSINLSKFVSTGKTLSSKKKREKKTRMKNMSNIIPSGKKKRSKKKKKKKEENDLKANEATKKGTFLRSLFNFGEGRLVGLAHLPSFRSRDFITHGRAKILEETLKHTVLL